MKTVIFLMGPTAVGKTALALSLHKRLPIDLISVDSALVYRGMDIGTAKPTSDVLAETPHALIDIREPTEAYSAAQFCEDAKQEITRSLAQERIPVLVGGTMLYFSSLQNGLNELPATDPAIRLRVAQQAQEHGWVVLHQRLAKIDPITAARIHPNDAQRISRALEVYEMTGLSLTEWYNTSQKASCPWKICSIAVMPDSRLELQTKIAQRFQEMLEQGFVKEVEQLRKRIGMHAELPSMRAVGYRQVWDYLEGKSDYQNMIEKGIIATRQLAKRQLTWLRSWPELFYVMGNNSKAIFEVEKQIIQHIKTF